MKLGPPIGRIRRCEIALPAASKPCGFEGLPRGDVVLLKGDHDAIPRRVAPPTIVDESGDHAASDSPADEIRLTDEVVDPYASAVAEGPPDRFTPLRVVFAQISLDIADGPATEVHDESFGWIRTVEKWTVALLDRSQV